MRRSLESTLSDICVTAGYFGAWRERVKQLAKALDLEYSGELVSGVTTILVVAESQSESCAELLLGPKARTAMQWGDIDIVRHQWLEDSAQHGALCDLEAYTLVPKKVWYFTPPIADCRTRILACFALQCSASCDRLWTR